MRKHETLKLHVRPNLDWVEVEVSLELISDDILGQRFTVTKDGVEIGVLERDKITEHHNVGRIRFDHKPKVMWRAKAAPGESFRVWEETRTEALEDMLEMGYYGMVHYAGRPGWSACPIC